MKEWWEELRREDPERAARYLMYFRIFLFLSYIMIGVGIVIFIVILIAHSGL